LVYFIQHVLFKSDKELQHSLNQILKNIAYLLHDVEPLALWSGHGYHVVIPVNCKEALEHFQEFAQYTSEPSKEFLPFTFNSKCIGERVDAEVKIIQRLDSSKPLPNIDNLLIEFQTFLVDQKLKAEIKQENRSKRHSRFSSIPITNTIPYVERLLEMSLKDYRKISISLILAPYFVNIKKLSDTDSFSKKPRLFSPSQSYVTLDGVKFERRYLRIRVKNTGFVKATNCEAKMQIIASNDMKQLVWDRSSTSGVLRDISLQKNIRARKGEELVHVVFSDSRFTKTINEEYRAYASVSTVESLMNQQTLALDDALRLGFFDIEITVLSDEGAFCKSTFRVSPNINHSQLSMTKLDEESGNRRSKLFKLKNSWI
jgi:hypothetical protein